MDAVFKSQGDVARMILECFPCLVKLVWIRRTWCINVRYRSISVDVAKSWYTTCQEQMKKKRANILTSSNLGDMHSAEVFFESDLMDIGWQLRDVLSCMSVYGENSNSVRKLFHRDEREFEYCLQTLDNRSKTSNKLRVLKITIPYLCDTQNLSAVANWILGLHFRCRKKYR